MVDSPRAAGGGSSVLSLRSQATTDSLRKYDTTTPVVVLGSGYGGLGVARTLGRAGVPVYAVRMRRSASEFSRYWRGSFVWDLANAPRDDSLAFLERVARAVGRAILLPSTDFALAFVSDAAEALAPWFLFPRQDARVIRMLMNKLDLYSLAVAHDVPTPKVFVPHTRDEVTAFSEQAVFPVMIKGIEPTRERGKTKVIAATPAEVQRAYVDAEKLGPPNLMLQEYIPGSDAAGWTFYGCFDNASSCLAGFTARKIRLTPAYTGVISLGVADDNEVIQSFCRRLMSAVGYRGVVNIGGKYDHRDGLYKVMDVNARLGASFRLCGSDSGFDVLRVLYLYMTGQRVPIVRAQVGRRWLLEEDLLSAWTYMRNRELTFPQWIQSLRGVDECAYWARNDPLPFVIWGLSSIWSVLSATRKRPLPASEGVSAASVGVAPSEPDASRRPQPGGPPQAP